MEKRELKLPEPERFAMPKEEDEARIFSLKGRKLQVRRILFSTTVELTRDGNVAGDHEDCLNSPHT